MRSRLLSPLALAAAAFLALLPAVAAQTCPVGYSVCDASYCISYQSTCCGSGNGASCPSGFECTSGGGCCPRGETCSTSNQTPACANEGHKLCGGLCIPDDGVCCDDKTYCYAGQTCASGGGCEGTATGLGVGPTVVLKDSGGYTMTVTVPGTVTPTAGDDDNAAGAVGVDGVAFGVSVVGAMLAMVV